MMPRWLIWTFLALFFWGIWAILAKVLGDQLSPTQTQIGSTFGLLPVILALAVSKKVRASANSKSGAALAFASGILAAIGNIAYYAVLTNSKASAVVPLTALYPLVTVLLAVIFLHEKLNRIQILGIFLSLLAIYFFNVPEERGFFSPWIVASLAPILLWGISGFLQKLATNRVSPELATVYFLFSFVAAIPLFLLTSAGPNADVRAHLTNRAIILVLLLGLSLALGNAACLLAYAKGKASIIAPLSGLYPIVSLPIAILFFAERPSVRESIGIALALAAVVAISIESKAPVPESPQP